MSEGDKLRRRLAALRRQLRFVASLRGLAYVVALFLAVILVAGLIDYLYDLYPLVRAVILTGLVSGIGLIFWKFLLAPLSQPMDDLSLALRIEERHPTLNDALASTVQFLDSSRTAEGESAPMRREMVRRTIGRVAGLDFNKIVDRKGLRSASLGAMAFLVVCICFALAVPELSAKAVWRLATPFSRVEWPKKTRLELDAVVLRIGRNREYRVSGIVRGVVPKEGSLDLAFDGLSVQRRPFAIKPDESGIERFHLSLKSDEVTRSFRFRLAVNDALTDEYRVEVLPLPQLDNLDGKPSPQLTLIYPAYTDLPSPHRMPHGNGNVDAVAGSVVEYRAATDRPLKRAWIVYQAEIRETLTGLMLSPLSATQPLSVVSTMALARQAFDPVPAQLSQDRRTLTVRFRPVIHGSYTLHFEDENDLENSRQYELRIKADPAPVVKLERPSPSRDVLSVLPDADIPLEVIVEDSMFAVRSSRLEYRMNIDGPVQALSLYDYQRGLNAELGAWLGVAAVAHPVPRLRLPRVEVMRTLALSRIKHPDGSALKKDDVVIIQAVADDFDDVTPKDPGRSHVVEIRIIDRSTLNLMLNQEETRLQQEIQRVRDKQREARERVAEIENRLRKDGKISPERESQKAELEAQKLGDDALAEEDKAQKADNPVERQKHQDKSAELRRQAQGLAKEAAELKRQAAQMAEAMEAQKQVRDKVGDDKQGLRAEIDRLRDTLKQNGLDKSNAMERASLVKKELDRLAEKELEQIEPKLADARRLSDLQDPQARQERMAELETRAKQAESEAKATLDQAKRLEEKATQAQAKADNSGNAEEKGKWEAEAKKARGEALAQQEKARDKQAQADAARDEARKPVDSSKVREEIGEARKAQEEVEKSLSSLLQDLEPSGSTREARREAGELLQKQREAMAELDEIEKKEKDIAGKSPDELNADQKSALEQAAEKQKKLTEQAEQLAGKMKRLAEERGDKDPDGAKAMKEAANQIDQGEIAGKMRKAQEAIAKNQLNDARQSQREALAELEKLEKKLEEKREEELDRLAKKLREAEKKVEQLMDEQEKLQKKIREAEKEKDEKKRNEELARLAKQQKQLEEKTEELLKDLSRLRNQRAKQALGAAGAEMAEAGRQLQRGGKQDDEKQEDVLDRLEETRRELEKARKKAEDELAREQLARVADTIKHIRERQQGHVEEAKRVQETVQRQNNWTRGLSKSVQSLGDNQSGLGEETDTVARRELSGSPVFSRLLQRASRSMDQGGKRAQQMATQKPAPDTLPDVELNRHQQDALRRLSQLLDSLKEAQNERRPLGEPPGGGGDDGNAGGGGGGDDSLPPMAQLKLLRSLQEEVNRRTEDFRRKNPNLEGLDAKGRAELDDIRREQKEVADLLEQMTRPPGEMPNPEAKDDKKDAKKENEK